MAYVSVMLIGSVVIDNQSILTLLEAWLTVARDLLYYTEQFTINARYQSAVNSKKTEVSSTMRVLAERSLIGTYLYS